MKHRFIVLFVLMVLLFSLSGIIKTQVPEKSMALSATCGWKKIAEYSGTDEDIFGLITIDPVNPKIIYVAYGWKIHKSVNCGKTWTTITGKLNYAGDIAVDYKDDNNVFLTTGNGFSRSVDGGMHWTRTLSKGMGGAPIEIDPKNPSIIYTGEYYGHIYKSTNGGISWTNLKDLGNDIHSISVSPIHTNIVYAGCDNGLYKSINGGSTWTKKSSSYIVQVKVSPDYDNIVYATTYDGGSQCLYKSTDSGNHWSKIINNNDVSSFAIDPKDPKTIYAGSWGGGVYRSNDRGTHWQSINSGLPNSIVKIKVDPVHPSVLYYVTQQVPGLKYTKIYRYSCPVTNFANFTAYFIGNSIYFSWKYSNPTDIDYFIILYKKNGSSIYSTLVPQIKNTKVSYFKSNFTTTNATFDFTIAAYRETEHSLWSHDTARHIKKPVITSVNTFTGTATAGKIKVSWNKTTIDSNTDYIKIYKNDPDCSSWLCLPIFVKTINKGSTDFNNGYTFIDGLKFNKKYFITIYSSDKDNGFGVDSNTATKTIFIPDIPTEFEAYSYGKKVTFVWKYNLSSQADIDKFSLFSMLPTVGYLGYVFPSSRTTYYHATLYGKYSFIVAAVKGNSYTYSMLDEAYVLNRPPKPVVSMVSSGIKIVWDKNAIDPNANKVEVYRSIDKVHYSGLSIIDKNTGQYIDTFAPAGNLYYLIKVLRVATNEHTDTSDPSLYAEIIFTVPASPTSLVATANSCSEVALTWQDNSDNEEHFMVERKTGTESYAAVATVDPDTNLYTDSSVEGGKIYYYRVKATNSTGDSGYVVSAAVNVPSCVTAPNEPEDLEATATSSSEIDLSWSDNSDNEDGFKIERKTSGGTYSVITTIASNIKTYKDSGLNSGTTYYYRVRAFNGEGMSAYTNEANATTQSNAMQQIIIKLQPDNEMMLVNGKQTEIDPGRGTKPVIIPKWSRTVVPIRAIVEALGGTISWKGTERKVTINFNNTTIELWIDNPRAKVNGETKWIDPNNHDVKPIIVNSRTMLPLRFVAESLGCTVDWDAATKTITITYPRS